MKVLQYDSKLWSESSSSNEWFQIIHTELDFNAAKEVILRLNDEELEDRNLSTKEQLLKTLEKLSGDVELADHNYLPLIGILIRFKKQENRPHADALPLLKISSSTLKRFGIRLYQKLLFSFHGNYESLRNLVPVMELLEIPYITSFPSGILSCAIDLARNSGLHIMEYYIGHKEEDCDEKRKLLWKLFVMDKWNYLADGRGVRLSNQQVTTFLPSKVQEVVIDFEQRAWMHDILTSYISYFEIEVSKVVSEMHLKVFCCDYRNSQDAVTEILNQLKKIQRSIIPQLRPGDPIILSNSALSAEEKEKVSFKALHFHLFYHLTISFLLRNTLDEMYHSHENIVIENELDILDLFFQFGVLQSSYQLSYVRFTISSACYLTYSYIKNPCDQRYSRRILKSVLKYSRILFEQTVDHDSNDHWVLGDAMFNSLVSPCIDVFELTRPKDKQNVDEDGELSSEIEDFKQRLVNFEEMSNNESLDAQSAIDQIFGVNFTDLDALFQVDGMGTFFNTSI